jgi:hypothetical protein
MRVFCDRLIDETDQKWVLSTIRDQISTTIGVSYSGLFSDASAGSAAGGQAQQSEDSDEFQSLRDLLYCNFEAVSLYLAACASRVYAGLSHLHVATLSTLRCIEVGVFVDD